jgi:membrane protein DedA with SNARE-associated domain
MTERIIAFLVEFISHVIHSGGYLGVTALMAVESACIPLPSEIILPFAGYQVYTGDFGNHATIFGLPAGLFWVATAGAIGCNIGSFVAYWIGAKGGRPLVERYGRWVLMSHHDLDLMTKFFVKYGAITVLLSRLLPVVRTFIAFPAGIARMPQARFHIYTFVGSWPWCFALAYAGMKLGEAWQTDPRFHEWFHRFHTLIIVVLVALAAWFLITHIRRARTLGGTA